MQLLASSNFWLMALLKLLLWNPSVDFMKVLDAIFWLPSTRLSSSLYLSCCPATHLLTSWRCTLQWLTSSSFWLVAPLKLLCWNLICWLQANTWCSGWLPNKAHFMALLKMLPCDPFVDFMKVFEAVVDFLTRLTHGSITAAALKPISWLHEVEWCSCWLPKVSDSWSC